jgi:hypothetical protein
MPTLAVVGTSITRSMARTLRYLAEGYSRFYAERYLAEGNSRIDTERLDQPVDNSVAGQPKLRIVRNATGKTTAV